MQELEQRYTRFRVEVQTALDKCESRATYASLAKRVIGRETSESNAVAPAASNRPALVKKSNPATGDLPAKRDLLISSHGSCLILCRVIASSLMQSVPMEKGHLKVLQGVDDFNAIMSIRGFQNIMSFGLSQRSGKRFGFMFDIELIILPVESSI